MIKQLSIVAAFSLLLFSAAAANASDTASASIDAAIITEISITNSVGLQFGLIAASTAGGTVTVTPAGVRSSSGVALASGTTVTAASFAVTGQASTAYTITLPAPGTTTITGPGAPMGVDFASSPADGGPPGSGLLSGAGAQTVTMGGTLTVGASQTTGAYSGTFSVSVAYD